MKEFLSKKISVKSLLILVAVVAIATVALASMPTQIQARLSPDITIKYNDVIQTQRDVNGNVVYPIIYNGTTYLPVRAVGNMLDIEVGWDQETKTVSLNDGNGGQGGPGGGPVRTGTIPAEGGSVSVNGTTRFSFTPNQSGMWMFSTSDCGYSDPYLWLYDSDDMLLTENDDGLDDYNSLIIWNLKAGETYTVQAGFWRDGTGSYTLDVSRPMTISNGSSIRVSGSSVYTFTPDKFGVYTFSTSNSGASDPYLVLFDVEGFYIADDDDGGFGNNALLTVPLNAGETYVLGVGFYRYGGSCSLTVSDAAAVTIPGNGGTANVDGSTLYMFTPGQSGTWEFKTSNNEYCDPYLWLYDASGKLIEENDDGAGTNYDDLNALITADLNAGTTYYLFASCFQFEYGSYTLTVTRK